MPAITVGHPFSLAYGAAIDKLKHASQKGNRPTRVVVADVFLEETVSTANVPSQSSRTSILRILKRFEGP